MILLFDLDDTFLDDFAVKPQRTIDNVQVARNLREIIKIISFHCNEKSL
jgi:hypothetical protein